MGLNRLGRITVVEDNTKITENDYLVDFKIEDNCYVNDKFIGTTVSKKITVNIINPNNSINLENKEIKVQTGININGVEELIPFGNFIIEKPENEEVKSKTSFTGYDYMIKFNAAYKDRIKYPIKLSELFEDVCNQVGVEAGNIDFTNADYMVLGNPFTNNEDCRTVLSNIAQLAGGFAHIGRDNKVYIVSLRKMPDVLQVNEVHVMTVSELNLIPVNLLSSDSDNADENLDGNNYFEDFSKNEEWGEINSVILRLSAIEGENTTIEDKDSITKNGLTEITISDNYFLTNQTEREKVIEPLWNTLKGIKYLPFKTKYYGYPYLDAGDIIYIKDSNDNGYVSYIFNHTFTFNGGFSGNIETTALTKTQTAYKNTNTIKEKFKQTERKIDKINGVITDVIEEQTETTNKLTKVTQDVDSIDSVVKSNTTDINNNYQDIIKKLDYKAQSSDVVSLEKKVEAIQTDTEYAIKIGEDIQVNGVSKVKTETGYTFDEKGLTVEKTNAKTKSTLNETGLEVKDSTGSQEEVLLKAGYDEEIGETIVKSKNMTVEKYLIIGSYSRIENYGEGTGVFWIGG